MQTVQFAGSTVTPSKIICIGRNYAAHIEELGNTRPKQMVIFAKPNSAITDTPMSQSGGEAVHYEGEICFICRAGTLAGVAFGLDLTKRECQDRLRSEGLPWERSKAFDGSAVFSHFAAVSDAAGSFGLRLEINGKIVQEASSELMLYQPAEILAEVRSFISVLDNDIIMTGTPAGVGGLKRGDVLKGIVTQEGKVLTAGEWHTS